MSLREKIEREIRERGPVPFSRYMELCLYDPAEGYYSRNAEQFGKAGDFYTSSDVHAVFGRLWARQFDEIWRALDCPPQIEILELGPGRGLFARDVLDWSNKKFPDFFAALTYTFQESSPALQAKLQENLAEHIATEKAYLSGEVGIGRAHVGAGAPTGRSEQSSAPAGVAPNSRLERARHRLRQRILRRSPGRDSQHAGQTPPRLRKQSPARTLAPSARRRTRISRPLQRSSRTGERIEVRIVAQDWIRQIAHVSASAPLLTIVIDYGYTREQQLAGRHRGTLMAYRHHSASPDPYQAPGEQDLTAHVNFSALAAACERAGMRCEKLFTQSQLLLGIGEKNQFADAFEDCRLPQERAKVALQLKDLVTPVGVGGNFQLLIASRGIEPKKIGRLSGLACLSPIADEC